MPDYPKKLIEVALPLEEINAASAREKSIRHGHPSTLHLWWARRPLAACRAVLFGQLVDDPSGYVDELKADAKGVKSVDREVKNRLKLWNRKKKDYDKAQGAGMPGVPDPGPEPSEEEILVERERERLFKLIRNLVLWENTNNEAILEPCREEIRASWRRTCRRLAKPEDTPLPPVLDPFAGGGSIPLEAQRLGLEAHASDLNPVAVLINKAMIEIPPKFAGQPPVHPEAREEKGTTGWSGAAGLAEDVRRYGQWMRDEAFRRIGHLYPPYVLTGEILDDRPDLREAGYHPGDELTVIAWLWARTVPSPNPALNGKPVPLVSSFWLSKKKGKEAYVEPVIEDGDYQFEIRAGKPSDPDKVNSGTKTGRGANFTCLLSGIPIVGDHVKSEGSEGRMGARLMAVVCEGKRGRVYLSPNEEQEQIANVDRPSDVPSQKLNYDPRNIWCTQYGLDTYDKLFTDRQLVALNTFCELVAEARERALADAQAVQQLPDDNHPLDQQGTGTTAYADALAVYLGFGVGRSTDYSSSICGWHNGREIIRNTFGRQALPMTWDYAETCPFSDSTGNFMGMLEWIWKVLDKLPAQGTGIVKQADASSREIAEGTIISSDPPYYDNIGYADLSDFFYVWLRKALQPVQLETFGTMLVPKAEELIAAPYRQGGKEAAETFFLDGMSQVAARLAKAGNKYIPATIYYAFKQSEKSEGGQISVGWTTFLDALLRAGFSVVGTWPMRTELANKVSGVGANMLASSIVLVCRKRVEDAPLATRKDFVTALHRELPAGLTALQHGNIAPVDLPQSSIGPGMAIFSRYSKVAESDGSSMSVRTALQLINHAVDEFLSEQEAAMDDWTRFAVTWFSQHGFAAGQYGDAENIATARGIAVDGVAEAGILESGGGKVRLLRVDELELGWNPAEDDRLTVWEIVHHISRALDHGGVPRAAALLKQVGGLAEDARALCYRLYTLCEKEKWTDEARLYNTLITDWPNIVLATESIEDILTEEQTDLEFNNNN